MSTELLEKVETILSKADVPERHTFFQLKNFVIGKEYTVQGQLWQVVRELRSRRECLKALDLQIADSEDNLELIDIQVQRLDQQNDRLLEDVLSRRELDIKKRKLLREKKSLVENIESLQSKKKYLLEEVNYLVGAFEKLNGVEEMKTLDDVNAQKQYWNEKLATHLNLKLLLKNPLDSEFVNTILSLDDDAPVKKHMIGMLDRVQKNMIEERDRQRSVMAAIEAAKRCKE